MDSKENIGIKPIIVDYLRQWKTIVVSGILALVVAVLYLVLYPVTYETMARVQIQEDRDLMSTGSIGLGEAAGMMRSFGLGGLAKTGVNIEDEIVTLYSSSLMSEMVKQLDLYVEYTKPYFFWYKMYGEEPVKVLCDTATLAKMDESVKFTIKVSANGKIHIKSKTKAQSQKFQFDAFPAVIELQQGRFVITKNPLSSETAFKINATVFPPSWVAETLAKEILIEDYSKSSNMIEFTCQDHKRQRAKDMLNTLIALYNQEAYSFKKKTGDLSLEFLSGRLESVVADLNDVERKIELYKIANKLTDVQADVLFYAESMKELQTKIIEIETQTTLVELMDAFVKDPKNRYALIPSLYTISTTEAESGSPISLYNITLLERERVIKNSGSEDNPKVAELTMQADKLRESVFQMIDNYHQSMVLAQQNLAVKEKQLLSRLDAVPAQERIYVDYKRQQEIYQGVYLILLQKREEIALSIGQNNDKAKIIDAAFVMKKPVQPRKIYALMAVVLLTFVLSVAWIFLKRACLSIIEEFKRTV